MVRVNDPDRYNWNELWNKKREPDSYDWEAAWDKPKAGPYSFWDAVNQRQNQTVDSPPTTTHNGAATAYGKKAFDEELAILRSTTEGSRNDQLSDSAFALAQLVAGGELPDQTTRQELYRTGVAIGLTQTETRNTIRSAFAAGLQQPRKAPPLETPPNVTETTAETITGNNAEEPLDYAAQFALDVEREAHRIRVREAAQRKLAQENAGPFTLPDFVPLNEFLAIPDTSTPYLVEGLWPKDGRVVFAAQNKVGKSTARDNIVKSLVDGYDFLNKYRVHMPADGRVVVIDDELHENQLRRWMRDHNIGNQNRVVVVPMRGKAATFDLTQPDIRAKWVAMLRSMHAFVVILDCLRPVLDALGLSEDKDAGKFLVQFDALLNEANVHEAMVIHHMGHSGERSRGDSRILDWPDAVWSLVKEKPDDPHSPRYFKAYGRDVEVYESLLGYDPHTRKLTIVGGNRTDAAAAKAWPDIEAYLAANPGASKNAIEVAVKGYGHTIRAIRLSLKEAIAEDWVIVDEGGKGNKTAHYLPNLDTSTDLDTTSTSNSQNQPRHLDTSSIGRGGEVEVNEVANQSQHLPTVEVPSLEWEAPKLRAGLEPIRAASTCPTCGVTLENPSDNEQCRDNHPTPEDDS